MSQLANDVFSQHLSDDEASFHEDESDNGTATNKPKQQQQLIPTTTTISNIKLPILKKEEYDIWAMEMEHYLEYIDNDVWKVIQNGNSKKRISTGKDGVIRVLLPVSAIEIHAVEKERKARTILLMAIPKEHLRRFHGMDDAKEIWEAIRTRFGGNANSKKMQKAVLKQQFEAFTISSSEGLEKGYDRFQQLLSQLEAHGAEVSTEDANHKFLRSLPQIGIKSQGYREPGHGYFYFSLHHSMGTPAGRVILFGTIPTTIPDTTPSVIPPTTHIDITLIPIVSPTIPPSPDYTPASLDYSHASDIEFDPSEDLSSDHIPPLLATLIFLSLTDDSSDSDIPDTPPSPTHDTAFTETTLSTQRSPVAYSALRRRVMILLPGQPIPHG
ncbi:hypothetical protein Tco_0222892 [Tanacetum coccineum]